MVKGIFTKTFRIYLFVLLKEYRLVYKHWHVDNHITSPYLKAQMFGPAFFCSIIICPLLGNLKTDLIRS